MAFHGLSQDPPCLLTPAHIGQGPPARDRRREIGDAALDRPLEPLHDRLRLRRVHLESGQPQE